MPINVVGIEHSLGMAGYQGEKHEFVALLKRQWECPREEHDGDLSYHKKYKTFETLGCNPIEAMEFCNEVNCAGGCTLAYSTILLYCRNLRRSGGIEG